MVIIPHAINQHLHAPSFPMLGHTSKHFQQMMKLHRNLKSLTQGGMVYEFLVEEYGSFIFIYPS